VIPTRPAHSPSPRALPGTPLALALVLSVIALCTAGCGKEEPKPVARPPIDVTAVTIEPRDTPVAFEFVGQTQSSREVEIRARVDGFLEKRVYVEGELVRTGQPMFLMDRKPFEAALQQAKGELAQRQAQLDTAKANLARIRPLAEQNAVSKKDLDDAVGAYQSAVAQVLSAKGNVRTAELNLGYTTISSPLTGLSSFAKVQDGAYVNTANNLLTSVSQLDPIWVNYSVSENELLKYREQAARGRLNLPPNRAFEVEVVLADGSVFPNRGRVSFADPSFSKETGTFLVRAVLANSEAILRPGQFVRVHVLGATRPNAILVPQRSVLQGAKSHFVWVIGKNDNAEQRVVEVGDWHGDDWFIDQGLAPGERIVVDGAIRVSAGATVTVVGAHVPREGTSPAGAPPTAAPPLPGTERLQAPTPSRRDAAASKPAASAPRAAPTTADEPPALPAAPAGTGPMGASIFFDSGSAALDPESHAAIAALASQLKANAHVRVDITGYADKTGSHARNVALAKQRASALHRALRDAGVPEHQLNLKPPVDVTGSPHDRQARRVDVRPADTAAGAPTPVK
jgi:membrane fusion protein, multidrug efflux system